MGQSFDAVLFDLDGTLLDTAPDLLFAMNLSLQQHQKPLQTYTIFRQHVSGGTDAMLCHAFNMESTDAQFPAIKQQYLTHYYQHLATHTCFFDGMEAVLDYLDAQHIPWGIVTNKPTRFTLPILDAFGLASRTQCVVMADTLEHMKPHPAPMLHACNLLNKKPERTLYIGDFKTDVLASRAANMPCLIVTHGYYLAHMNPRDWGADITVDRAQDIIPHLTNCSRNQHDNHSDHR